jgi:hypothetical protein
VKQVAQRKTYRTTIQPDWSIELPAAFLERNGIQDGDDVDLTFDDYEIVVSKVPENTGDSPALQRG